MPAGLAEHADFHSKTGFQEYRIGALQELAEMASHTEVAPKCPVPALTEIQAVEAKRL